jgi:VWFA-related protein
MRLFRGLVLLACGVTWLWPMAVYAADPPQVQVTQVDNSRYPEVTIYVSVTEADGQIVSGLQQSDFEIAEDGTPVAITDFRGGDQVALATVLVIDRSGSMDKENKLAGAQQAAVTFVDLMRRQDQTALVSFSETAWVDQPFTADQAALKRAIKALSPDSSTAWYDAVYEAAGQFQSVSGRRAIILLSDGLDNQSRQSLAAAIQAAHTTGLPVYAIGLGARGSYDEVSLKRVAQQTDGQFYHAPTAAELKALYESLAVSLQRDYAITYRSPRPTNDGTRRNIGVAVGGATGSSQYLETHLLNIRSNVITGLGLILPLLAALIAPLAITKRRAAPVSAAPLAPPPAVIRSVEARPPAAPAACLKCGAPLRFEARFCAKCGTPMAQPAPNVCPHCRTSLRPGAKFCAGCGAQRPRPL